MSAQLDRLSKYRNGYQDCRGPVVCVVELCDSESIRGARLSADITPESVQIAWQVAPEAHLPIWSVSTQPTFHLSTLKANQSVWCARERQVGDLRQLTRSSESLSTNGWKSEPH